MLRAVLCWIGFCLAGLLGAEALVHACSGDLAAPVGTDLYFPLAYGDHPTRQQLQDLGRRMFLDARLSASGQLACSSCHSPEHAYGPPNALMTEAGGAEMNRLGFRNTPSLRYLHSPIAFTQHFLESEVNGGEDDEGPTGGRTWDGRVSTAHEQATMPLLDQNEMANGSFAEIANRVAQTDYAEDFRAAFSASGENVFDNTDAVVGWMTVALETFEQTPADFHPFTSKYDAYLRDEVELSAQEQRGLEAFNDMKRGNCAACHPSGHKSPTSHLPIFTDFGFVAIGVPRNRELAVNRDPAFFDLGLCGPLRTDLRNRPEYCGMFRTPSLRNVAMRRRYFHNGVFGSLRQVVEFYATRETTPQKWYSRDAAGAVVKYDDLPARYQANINREAPFAPRQGKPRLTPREIDDIVAFLQTLNDGYRMPATAHSVAQQTVVAAGQAAP